MHETDENKKNGNLPMQNVIGKETLAAPMYKKTNFVIPSCTDCEQSNAD